MQNTHTGSHRGVVDPDAAVGTIWADLVESRRDAAKHGTVRPFDRQRNKVRRVRRDVPALRATIDLRARHGIRSPERIARTISSARPA